MPAHETRPRSGTQFAEWLAGYGIHIPKSLRWIRYTGEAIATIGLFVFAFGLHLAVSPEPLVFLERDLTLSYPLVRPETVPVWLLFVLSICIPALFVALGHLWHGIKRHGSLRHTVISFLWCLLGILQALAITFAMTNLLKFMTGRQRPNFFALCNYAGYRDAVASGDFSRYNAQTTVGAFGSVSKCKANFQDVADSLRSFPSGHSSVSFAGMMFASMYLRASFGVGRGVHVSVLAIMSTLPLVVSAWIAISRVRDRWHNTDDVFIGSCIGIISGYLAWRHYVTLRREGMAPKHGAAHIDPREDRDVVKLKLAEDGPIVTAAVVSPSQNAMLSPGSTSNSEEGDNTNAPTESEALQNIQAIGFALNAAHRLAGRRHSRGASSATELLPRKQSTAEDPGEENATRAVGAQLPHAQLMTELGK